ncbi:MAG: type II toxin-antitoxin system RelE/ParE family toxin [Gaiellaceae bacterium MAG52_C11]|nr:type II toxin-antitoxin system RelE/ParE family toxin [Candidatus Gaiellasilicea maunaloa]
MARVEVSPAAAEDLARLRVTHRLPADTNARVRRSIRSLGRFPRLGTALEGAGLEARGWEGFRFVLGPWRWMIIVYDVYEDEDRVVIATIQDGRSSTAATVALELPADDA